MWMNSWYRSNSDAKGTRQQSLVAGAASISARCLLGADSADDRGELLGPGYFRPGPGVLRRHGMVQGGAERRAPAGFPDSPVPVFRCGTSDPDTSGNRGCPDDAEI